MFRTKLKPYKAVEIRQALGLDSANSEVHDLRRTMYGRGHVSIDDLPDYVVAAFVAPLVERLRGLVQDDMHTLAQRIRENRAVIEGFRQALQVNYRVARLIVQDGDEQVAVGWHVYKDGDAVRLSEIAGTVPAVLVRGVEVSDLVDGLLGIDQARQLLQPKHVDKLGIFKRDLRHVSTLQSHPAAAPASFCLVGAFADTHAKQPVYTKVVEGSRLGIPLCSYSPSLTAQRVTTFKVAGPYPDSKAAHAALSESPAWSSI